jgi:hypothetical protein
MERFIKISNAMQCLRGLSSAGCGSVSSEPEDPYLPVWPVAKTLFAQVTLPCKAFASRTEDKEVRTYGL